MHKSAYGHKETFWNTRRVEMNVTIAEVTKYLKSQGLSYHENAVGMFFTGQAMPRQEVSDALCAWFEVDKTQGYLEFQHAHRSWKARKHGESAKLRPNKPEPEVEKKDEAVEVDFKDNKSFVEVVNDDLVYRPTETMKEDAISVSDVRALLATRRDLILSEVYGKVDQSLYEKIRDLFEVAL